jgi:hypothetical protein
MSGYVYCFSNDTMVGIYKIGLTTRIPLMRLKEANMGDTWSLTSKFNIEFAKEVIDCRKIEKQLHKLLSLIGERVCENREFFKVSLEIIKSVFDLIDGKWYDIELDENHEILTTNEIISKKCIDITESDIINCENAITCVMCSKLYKNLATYNQHIAYNRCNKILIKRPIDYKCKYCEDVFASKQSKNRHEVKCRENNRVSTVTVQQINKIVDDKIKSMKYN